MHPECVTEIVKECFFCQIILFLFSMVVSLLARTLKSEILGLGGTKWIKIMAMCCLHMLFAKTAFWLLLRVFYVFGLASFLMIDHKCVVVSLCSWENWVLNSDYFHHWFTFSFFYKDSCYLLCIIFKYTASVNKPHHGRTRYNSFIIEERRTALLMWSFYILKKLKNSMH